VNVQCWQRFELIGRCDGSPVPAGLCAVFAAHSVQCIVNS